MRKGKIKIITLKKRRNALILTLNFGDFVSFERNVAFVEFAQKETESSTETNLLITCIPARLMVFFTHKPTHSTHTHTHTHTHTFKGFKWMRAPCIE